MKNTKKVSMLSKQKNIIIVAAVVFAILLTAYLAVVRPLLATNNGSGSGTVQIWESEQSFLMFEEISREEVDTVKIHNPKNPEKYQDWGFFKCLTENQKTLDGVELVKDETYILGFEYAPYDDTAMATLATDARYTVFSKRLHDHCPDDKFADYGLVSTAELEAALDGVAEQDKQAALEKALEKYTYYTLKTTTGKTHTVVIGDSLATGSSRYVRVVDMDKNLETSEMMYRDSVYVVSYEYLTGTPLSLVTTVMTYPVDPQNSSTQFEDFLLADMVVKVDENKNPILDKDGKVEYVTNPIVKLSALKSEASDPFSQFASMVSYKVNYPYGGYYGSTSFDDLFSYFSNCAGDEVVALGHLKEGVDDKTGEKYYVIGFDDETFAKYGLDKDIMVLYYTYDVTPDDDSDNPIESYLNISPLQADGYYYAYSLLYNTICRVSPETLYFLDWDVTTYIQTSIFQLKIDNTAKIELEGSYFDMNIGQGLPAGIRDVNLTFSLTETVGNLTVNCENKLKGDTADINTDDFRELYKVLLQVYLKEEVPKEQVEEAMKEPAFATIRVITRDQRVTDEVTDKDGKITYNEYYLHSVTRTFRFYRLSSGRLICTIQDTYFKTDDDGNIIYKDTENGKEPVTITSAESGAFYVVTSRIEQALEMAEDLYLGLPVDEANRT